MSKVKQVEVQQGDDLRAIALRELGDPTRWTELASLNDLRLPFITPSFNQDDRIAHTLLWGDQMLIPWETNSERVPMPISNFGTDIALPAGRLSASANGDLVTIAGRANIVQALSHRIKTLRAEMVYHPEYGCHVSLALGMQAIPMVNLMAAAWVYEALVEEPRLALVQAVDANAQGDTLAVEAVVLGVTDNTPIDFNLVLNP